jgi:hypothetical protein
VSARWTRETLSLADQSRIDGFIQEAAAMVAAPIWELGVEPSDVTSDQPLYTYGRRYIICHCCAEWARYTTRQETDYAKAQTAERDKAEALIKKYAVGNQGEDFNAKEHLGSFRGGRARAGIARGLGGRWSSKTRM